MKTDNDKDISEELLNSYLDNELGSEEKDELLSALEDDADLSRRLCELRNVKELTQHAYQMKSRHARQHRSWLHDRFPLSAAASVLMMLTGIAAGWYANDRLDQQVVSAGTTANHSLPRLASNDVSNQKKVILHVDSAEPERFTAALDSAEALLTTYAQQNRMIQVEIVANAEGLNLFRADKTAYAERLHELKEKYGNLSLVACNRAIHRLEELGIDVKLIPDADVAPNALDEIVKRLQQGWVYIKV